MADYLNSYSISYKSLGNNRYQVDLTLYSEGKIEKSPLEDVQSFPNRLTVSSAKLKSDLAFTLTKAGMPSYEQPYCGGAKPDYNDLVGVWKYIYSGEITLPALSDDWLLSFKYDFRSRLLNTVKDPKNASIYVEALINNLKTPNNNSAKPLASPVVGAFKNTQTSLNLSASDVDNHVLSYNLMAPRVDATVELAYATGYSALRPVSSASDLVVNPATGILPIKPSKENERGIVDLKITEKDALGNIVGYTTHGVQISTTINKNVAPTLSGFNGSNTFTHRVCQSDFNGQLMVQINDPNASDIEYTIATFSSKNNKVTQPVISGRGILLSTASDTGTYEFKLAVKEVNNCPNNLGSDTITYKFQVVPNPQVTITVEDNKQYYTCYDLDVTSNVTGGTAPYRYRWNDGKTSPHSAVEKDEVMWIDENSDFKELELVVTDTNGCSVRSNRVRVELSLHPQLSITSPTSYCVTSTSTKVSNSYWPEDPNDKISEFSWTVEDGTVFTDEELNYKFPKVGDNTVVLRYLYDHGKCEYKRNVTVEICAPPTSYELRTIDTCAKNYIFYYSMEPKYPDHSLCSGYSQKFYLDGQEVNVTGSGLGKDYFEFPDLTLVQGKHQLTVKSDFSSECLFETSDSISLYENPIIHIGDRADLIFPGDFVERDCRRPDTTFHAVINKNLNGPLEYSWNLRPMSPVEDSIVVSDNGTYILLCEDPLGCKDIDTVSFIDPISSISLASLVQPCYPDSTFKFQATISENFPQDSSKIERTWAFGDTVVVKTFADTISHDYTLRKQYTATLKITTENNCVFTSNPVVVNNEYVTDIFKVKPHNSDTVVCLPSPIVGYSLSQAPLGSTINRIIWYVNDVPQSPSLGDSTTIYLTAAGSTKFRFEATYNNSCIFKSKDTTIHNIFPDYNVRVVPTKYCVTDSVEVNRVVYPFDVRIKQQHWSLTAPGGIIGGEFEPNPIIQGTVYTNFNPAKEALKTKFDNRTTIEAHIRTVDEHGCVRGNVLRGIELESTAKITALFDTACELSATQIRLFTENRDPITGQSAVLQRYGISTNGIVLDSGLVDRDNITNSIGKPLAPIFKTPGIVPITIFAINDKNRPYEVTFPLSPGMPYPYPRYCRFTIDTNIYVRPAPELDFSFDTVCAGVDSVHFINRSYYDRQFKYKDVRDSSIAYYTWHFGDGDSLRRKHAAHWYKTGGKIPVTLSATTHKCVFDYTDTIYVKETPKADFIYNPDSIKAEVFKEITFNSTSTPLLSIDKYLWNFGDQSPERTGKDTAHTYTDINRYKVTLVVSNKEGCADTAVKFVELGSILDIPTAFSPNGDSKNDVFRLIQRYIDKLDQFTVYNRWGQVVFDAGNNVEAIWDGKYNDVDQEMGIYMVYVKGRGKDKKEYNFKKDITLVR
ncbi:MAG TPA: PKD domain-containing protein [Cytophagales bacterium]|nr:PKD domain-containing protein [Cytophagales bacterium]